MKGRDVYSSCEQLFNLSTKKTVSGAQARLYVTSNFTSDYYSNAASKPP